MDARLLVKLFGAQQHWHGTCLVIVDAGAGVQAIGADSIGSSAIKSYAPRFVSGRIQADAACLFADGTALLTLPAAQSPPGTERRGAATDPDRH